MRSWSVQRGAAGQVETQATGRSSCSAVSSCPVVPSGRGVLGWVFSAAVLEPKRLFWSQIRTFWNHNVRFGIITRTSWNSVAIGDLFRLQCVQMCTDVYSKGNFLSAFWKCQSSIDGKSSFAGEWQTCLDRSCSDQLSRSQTHPPAVLTAGTPCHLTVRLLWWCPALTPAGGWPVLCAKLSLQALRVARWTPYGAMDPVAGCRWGSGTS